MKFECIDGKNGRSLEARFAALAVGDPEDAEGGARNGNITLADKILINHVPAAYCTQGC